MESAKDIILSKEYQDILTVIKSRYGLRIFEGDDEVLFAYDEKKMTLAGFGREETERIFATERERFLKFIELKLELNKAIEEGEKNQCLKVHGYGKDFVLIYMIEYWLLGKGMDNLISYLKAIRIPGVKKYAGQLRQLYSRL